MNVPNQRLGDGRAAVEVFGNQLERLTIVEEFANVVRIGVGDRFPLPELAGLIDRELRPLDVRREMRLQQEGAAALRLPSPRRAWRRRETAFDARQVARDPWVIVNCGAKRLIQPQLFQVAQSPLPVSSSRRMTGRTASSWTS
jgi:hypothetical protein